MKIKDLNILDIANELLVLKKSGNNYFANCPHHSDTTPSLCYWAILKRYAYCIRDMWWDYGRAG